MTGSFSFFWVPILVYPGLKNPPFLRGYHDPPGSPRILLKVVSHYFRPKLQESVEKSLSLPLIKKLTQSEMDLNSM